MEKKLNEFTRWQTLKSAARLPFVRSIYIWIFLVPVAANALENIPDSGTFAVFGQTMQIDLSLPFSWVAFYFSAVFFAIANLLYSIRCPAIIQENDSFSDFRMSKKGVIHLDRYLFEAGMNWEGLRQALQREDEHFHENVQIEVFEGEPDPLQRQFWMVMGYADDRLPRMRYIVAASYLFAFLLISFVILENLILVFNLGVLP